MFPFDQAALPQLHARRAILIVDFQNDFIGSRESPLLVIEPPGFVERTVELAGAFRSVGDVVWIQSRFDKPRGVESDRIIVSDGSQAPEQRPSQSRQIISAELDITELSSESVDSEAFLSHHEPVCIKPLDVGCEMPPTVKQAVSNLDLTLTKSHYSAFEGTHLLRLLRGKMVMEVFICGSLANVGVFSTAMDAAGHGMSITVVNDCCGYRSEQRQLRAIRKLVELTGCNLASSQEILDTINPNQVLSPMPTEATASLRQRQASLRKNESPQRTSMSPDIVRPMDALRLSSASPIQAAADGRMKDETFDRSLGPIHTQDVDWKIEGIHMKPQDSILSVHEPGSASQKLSETKGSYMTRECGSLSDTDVYSLSRESLRSDTDRRTTFPSHSTAEQQPRKTLNPKKNTRDQGTENITLHQNGLCEGDMDVIYNAIPHSLANGAFEKLQQEVRWQRMSHQGGEVPRLVAVQGEIGEDGSIPVYRHPADESPPLSKFSPTVLAIKIETEKHLGHPLNHVLIQFYRSGNDYISEHSDKTLDIVHGSYIANVSLGAERTMILRTKRLGKDPSGIEPAISNASRQIQRARLSHNSLCRMGLQTNMKWLHAIRQDKRADKDKTASELAYLGGRISLTFRQIGTFLDKGETVIWGQGATGKTRETAHAVVIGQCPEAVMMLRAFGNENHSSNFDWNAQYGAGFDVLHINNSPRLFASGDAVVNMRIIFMLSEYDIRFAKGSLALNDKSKNGIEDWLLVGHALPIRFVDNDPSKSTIYGDIAIMLYLHSCYGSTRLIKTESPISNQDLAKCFTCFQQGLALLNLWRSCEQAINTQQNIIPKRLTDELEKWDGYISEVGRHSGMRFISGKALSLPDFAVWPVLHSIVESAGFHVFDGLNSLCDYYANVLKLESTARALGEIHQSRPIALPHSPTHIS